MSRAIKISNIVEHCSAGFSPVESIEDFWARPKSKGGLGWNGKGYHIIVDLEGELNFLKSNEKRGYSKNQEDVNFELITNGVKGFNETLINICYIGGVENLGTKTNPIWKAKDTRTGKQKQGLEKATQIAVYWLRDNGKDITKNLGVVGHRDFSKDNNSNGVIESWERIKECPSHDVIKSTEHYLYSSPDRYNKLPTI